MVDWCIDETVWSEAGRGYHRYASMRRQLRQPPPGHLLTDFVIRAIALVRKHRLLTLDQKIYRRVFPDVQVIGI